VQLVGPRRARVTLNAAFRRVRSGSDNGYCFELACPWQKLGSAPRAGLTLGFDATVYDADDESGVQIEAAWRVSIAHSTTPRAGANSF